ncbi:hypothetical protein HLB44_00240 [Aquincola sp. S2]|uniref:Phasin family protein n=1 Tax=Pseudaquabacterium terrae TaxID=2732868 RepID=A0ABX2EA40_9BURK|nr:hypothetical protein [Aquabacterium terrae]NRF65401.1 hypothetical protein [Aquabacterium terrae]
MQQGSFFQSGSGRQTPVQVTTFALRSLGQLYDMNLAATRVLLQTQARAASAFGWPDLSGVFDQVDERARSAFATGAEQIAQTAQRANEAAAELQRQVGRVVETQAVTMTERLQQGLQELGSQTSEGLQQLCETARAQADEAERVSKAISQELRDTLREGGQQARSAIREGGERLGETLRQGGQQTTDALRQGGQEARDAAQRGPDDAGRPPARPAKTPA